jgi:ATP-dependent RNA helicase DeaD
LTVTFETVTAGEAASSFNEFRISNGVLAALADMNIETPTPIQAATLAPLLDGRDVIGQARTGSGKTLAFGIPAIEFAEPKKRAVQVLILTPTRELAVQIGSVLEPLGARKGVKVGLIYGGRAIGPQRMMLKQGIHVVVGTPGRVLDLANQGALWLNEVRFLVLDEADEMLDRGFAPDVERIMARVTSARQTALFSATFSEWIRKTIDRHLDDPVTISVDPNPEDAPVIEHIAYDLGGLTKLDALKSLLDNRPEGSTIVFGKTKHGVKKLARQLELAGYPVAALQGNLSQNARDRVMEDFRSGQVEILLATNVAARGLDVSHVGLVINAELPESSDLLTHRIGRTGRMGREGQAITLLGPEDQSKWRQIERGLGKKIRRVAWPGGTAAIQSEPVEQTVATPRPRRENAPARARRPERPASRDAVAPAVAPAEMPHRANTRRSPRPADVRPLVTVDCTACGGAATLRFQPDPTRPVYCDSCFSERKNANRRTPAARA